MAPVGRGGLDSGRAGARGGDSTGLASRVDEFSRGCTGTCPQGVAAGSAQPRQPPWRRLDILHISP